MTGPRLDIGVLLPDLLNLHADAGNALVLATRARWEGIDARVTVAQVGEELPGSIDIWIAGDGDDRALAQVREAMQPLGITLADAVAGGAALVAVGLGWHLLSASVECEPGIWRSGAGVFAGEAGLLPSRASTELVTDSPWGAVAGYENHARGYRPGGGEQAWGRVRSGVGNGDGDEGVVRDGLLGTHLHGPVLAHTPRLADALLDRAMRRRHEIEFTARSSRAHDADAFAEEASRAAIEATVPRWRRGIRSVARRIG